MSKKIIFLITVFALLGIKLYSQGAPACPVITPVASPSSLCPGNCSNLTATVVSNQATTSYSVSSIPYAPYAYAGGTAVSVGTDDVWSGVINLPFAFCYYGTSYTQCLIGSNGQITFNLSSGNINGSDAWSISAAMPSTANMPSNTICGVFRDIDPALGGTIKYYVTGAAPCRALVVYYSNVPLFDKGSGTCDGTPNSTFEMVLYETTNYIDVYVNNSYSCSQWNGGYGIIGIQNAAGTAAVCAPGWNYPSTPTGNNIAFRFTPTGAPSYSVTWTGPSGTVGTGLGPINVCPTTNTTYTATMVITDCNGATTTYSNTTAITVTAGPTVTVNSPTICKGNSATLTSAGATTYSWTPATGLSGTTGASVTANPTVTTTYTVTGTTGGCSGTTTSTVTVNPTPTVTVGSATICPGSSTTMSAAGASTYTWAPAGSLSSSTGTTVTATPASTTVYTITGASAAGCTATATSTVTIGGAITPTVPSATICNGSSTTLNASGGTTYTWSPATGLSATTGASVTANPTSTTTYTINAASGACTGTTTAVVTVNPLPTVTVNSPSICVGASTTLNASGATTYSWSPATGLSATTGASVTANPTVTTTYTIVGTTATCTAQATSIVTVNPLPTVTVASATICPGASTTMSAAGASTYTWAPAGSLSSSTGTTVTATPASTTVYTITGASAAGCTATTTATVTIGGAITPTVPSATICNGSSTTLNASGGTTYTWSPATGLSATTGASVTANPTSTTTYTINAASGACTGSTTAVVTVNPLPTVTVNSPSICVGASTTLNAGGATTYSWSPATGLSATTGASVTANPTVTTTYTIVGTTATCTSSATSIVTVNPLPTVTSTSAAVCPGGTGTLNASGASTYTWNTGATGATLSQTPATTTNYTVTGTSAAGCVNTATTTINVLTGLTITPPSATICIGASATLTASGAATYTWSPATGLSSTNGASVVANPTVSTTYTITGSSGTCSAVATATMIVNPLPPVTVTSGTICVGQQTANLTGGGASTYSWTPSTGLSSTNTANTIASPTTTTSYTVTGTDANGCVNTATTAVTVNPLPVITVNSSTICPTFSATLNAGGASTYVWNTGATGSSLTDSPAATTVYTVVGTDVNGCVSNNTATITVNPTLLVSAGNNTPICAGTTINLTATTGIIWSWTGPGGYTSTLQNPSITNATPAMSGTYSVTAIDANGCQGSATTTVTVNPLPPVVVNSGTICVGQQTATLNAGGASTYSWNPSTGLSSSSGASVTATPTITTAYTVTGTDGNGCVSTATTAVTVNPLPTITVNSATICPTFSATLTAGGASTYAWNTGATGSSLTDSPAATTAYTVVGTDVNGCISSNTATITVNPTLLVSAGNNTPICQGGTINLTSSTGAVWSWSGPGGYTSTSQNPSISNATPAMSGTYSVTATDANGCQGSATTNVTVNALPVPTIGSNGPVCVNQTLNLNSGGGSTYSWNGPGGFTSAQQNPSITGVTTAAGGVYTITVIDANTCVNTTTLNVVVNPLPVVTVTGSTVCVNGTINLGANGGTAYSWSGPGGFISNQQNPSINPSTLANAGTYVVTVTDGNNCVNANVANVVVNSLPVVSVTTGQICAGKNTALTASGASTYVWSPTTGLSSATSSAPVCSPMVTTVYTVTGTDMNGCQSTATTTLVVTPGPPAVITPSLTIGCAPVCTTFANTDTTNASVNTYNWTFGNGQTSSAISPSACYNIAGNYTVGLTVTNPAGCIGVSTATVNVYPVPQADFSSTPQPTTILDNTVHFYDQTTGGAMITNWHWNLGNNTTSVMQNPSCLYGDTGSYAVQLVVTSNHGCKDSVIKYIRINDEFSLYVPNAFSPNSDGVNDIFYAKGEGVKDFKMWIFDRWGNQVFFTDDINKGWDGRYQSKGNEIVQEDVYVWKIQCKTNKGEKKQLSGHVSLLK